MTRYVICALSLRKEHRYVESHDLTPDSLAPPRHACSCNTLERGSLRLRDLRQQTRSDIVGKLGQPEPDQIFQGGVSEREAACPHYPNVRRDYKILRAIHRLVKRIGELGTVFDVGAQRRLHGVNVSRARKIPLVANPTEQVCGGRAQRVVGEELNQRSIDRRIRALAQYVKHRKSVHGVGRAAGLREQPIRHGGIIAVHQRLRTGGLIREVRLETESDRLSRIVANGREFGLKRFGQDRLHCVDPRVSGRCFSRLARRPVDMPDLPAGEL